MAEWDVAAASFGPSTNEKGSQQSHSAGPAWTLLQKQADRLMKGFVRSDGAQDAAREHYAATRAQLAPGTQANAARIAKIRDSADSGLDALARLFEDDQIIDDGTPSGRLRAILIAMEEPAPHGMGTIPGSEFGVRIGDSGFRGRPDPVASDGGFRDPFLSSANQASHFLTAVGLGFDPSELAYSERFPIPWERFLVGADPATPDREAAMRLLIGHEKMADVVGTAGTGRDAHPGMSAAALARPAQQYAKTTTEDLTNFQEAVRRYEADPNSLEAKDSPLTHIAVDPTQEGNSYQDLRLSLVGWNLGEKIARGDFPDRRAVGAWLRERLGPSTGPTDDAHLTDAEVGRLLDEGRMAEFLIRPRGAAEQTRVLRSLAHSKRADAIAPLVNRLDRDAQNTFNAARGEPSR
jgi:hypothetical protein